LGQKAGGGSPAPVPKIKKGKTKMTLREQIEKLAEFIIENFPDEAQDEKLVVDCAIRIMSELQQKVIDLTK